MDCHRCQHNVKVSEGFYKDFPWNETPCSACASEKNPNHMSEFDECRPAPEPIVVEDLEAVLPVAVLAGFVAGLLRLKPRLRDAVCLRYERRSWTEIGETLGIKPLVAKSRVRRAIEVWPELKVLLPVEQHVFRRNAEGVRIGLLTPKPAKTTIP